MFHVPYDGISSGAEGGHDDTPTDSTVSNNVNKYNAISNNLIHDSWKFSMTAGQFTWKETRGVPGQLPWMVLFPV
jgi:hypothetical protein